MIKTKNSTVVLWQTNPKTRLRKGYWRPAKGKKLDCAVSYWNKLTLENPDHTDALTQGSQPVASGSFWPLNTGRCLGRGTIHEGFPQGRKCLEYILIVQRLGFRYLTNNCYWGSNRVPPLDLVIPLLPI